MRELFQKILLLVGLIVLSLCRTRGEIIYETTSPYHHIRVIDQQGIRLLSFDGSMETKMSLRDPLTGHFQYTEFFHMPWLWHTQMSNVLMVGLGGASTQRAYAHYYPDVTVETVEIDSAVARVARDYFHFQQSPRQRLHLSDGRVFLRRTQNKYDALLMDAYVENRYGSFLPQHLVTKEFFDLANTRLTTNGVLAYNVIGNLNGWRADLLGAIYQTMKAVFPHVYLFPASDSQNVVLIATKSTAGVDFNILQQRMAFLIRSGRVRLPTFRERVYSFRVGPPGAAARSPILTDDYAPVDGLLNTAQR